MYARRDAVLKVYKEARIYIPQKEYDSFIYDAYFCRKAEEVIHREGQKTYTYTLEMIRVDVIDYTPQGYASYYYVLYMINMYSSYYQIMFTKAKTEIFSLFKQWLTRVEL